MTAVAFAFVVVVLAAAATVIMKQKSALDLSNRRLQMTEASFAVATEKIAQLVAEVKSMEQLWLVGQYRFGDNGAVVWDFQGVFTSREEAVAACKAANWFIAEVEVGKQYPETTEVMPGVEWPLLKEVA